MKKGLILIGVIAVVVIGAVAYQHYHATGAPVAQKVLTAVVKKGTLRVRLYAT